MQDDIFLEASVMFVMCFNQDNSDVIVTPKSLTECVGEIIEPPLVV